MNEQEIKAFVIKCLEEYIDDELAWEHALDDSDGRQAKKRKLNNYLDDDMEVDGDWKTAKELMRSENPYIIK